MYELIVEKLILCYDDVDWTKDYAEDEDPRYYKWVPQPNLNTKRPLKFMALWRKYRIENYAHDVFGPVQCRVTIKKSSL